MRPAKRRKEAGEGEDGKGRSRAGKKSDIGRLERMCRSTGYLSSKHTLHQKRFLSDPMYGALFCPRAIVKVRDEESGEIYGVPYLDNETCCALDFMEERYGADVADDKFIQSAFDLLRTIPDPKIQLFALLWIECREPTLAHFRESRYKQGSLHGVNNLRAMLKAYAARRMQVAHSCYNKHNVVTIVDQMVESAVMDYVSAVQTS